MLNNVLLHAALAASLIIGSSRSGFGATFEEDFASNPDTRGWRVFGETSLFQWNSTNQSLEVTWDSSKRNSYFYRPLGTILSRDNDFSLAFDLRLNDIAIGTTPGKPSGFEIAVGLLHWADATNEGFLRGTGSSSPNLAEFDFFPDFGFGPTVSPTLISSNGQFATSFNVGLDLTTNDLFHVVMTYTASDHTLRTFMTKNGQPFGPIRDVVQDASFTDFRLDQVALCSYSDEGQDPLFSGSVLAHGVVDNLAITTPAPPVSNLVCARIEDRWQVQFEGQTNWLYTLERTTDFQSWSTASPPISGFNGPQTLSDTNPSADRAFYRVRAERP